MNSTADQFKYSVSELQSVLQTVVSCEKHFIESTNLLTKALLNGHKILTCGNGGSAAEALHLAEELSGRYRKNRPALPGICLAADPTALTCIANDYGFDEVFSRQVAAIGNTGDVLVVLSTSGNSPNIIKAIQEAQRRNIQSIMLSGGNGGIAAADADVTLLIPSVQTSRIQELHLFIIHNWLECIETALYPGINND